ncbi:isoprenyl transferase [Thiocapsa imhoffii]|uniref:isoprenyl transferase n=1 Tax=Thiocapsa imhoffii TaxID=382777 RepID=UPI0030B88AE4
MADPTPLVPCHVAVIMDGNGRWAKQRGRPRTAGHREGVKSVRAVVEASAKRGVRTLTLFAFSSENWQRPRSEVNILMELFMSALRGEVRRLNENDVRLRVIGDRSAFPERLQQRIHEAEELTGENTRLNLQVAANYGGRWDLTHAARRLAEDVQRGVLDPGAIDEQMLTSHLSFPDLPDPDLLIRTGGEQRLSNFVLWQSAYSELYFTDVLWPDFDAAAYHQALDDFARRQRRYGKLGEQVETTSHASARGRV